MKMTLINICLLLVLLLSKALAIKLDNSPQVYLDSIFKGSTCGSVYSNGHDAYIMVELDDLYLESKVPNKDTLSLPIAIFRYPHIVYYDGFPTYDEFNNMYTNPKKFRQEMYNNILHLNITEINNSYLVKKIGNPTMYVDNFIANGEVTKREIRLEIEQSGIYCVYIVPPQEYALKGFMTATVTYINSYGYLKDEEFDQFRSLIFSSVFGTIILIGIVYYYNYRLPPIISFARIYTGIIYYGLIPIILVNVLFIIPFVIKNIIFPSENIQHSIFYHFNHVIIFLRSLLMIYVCDYLPLVFAKGYGIIHDGSELEIKNNVPSNQMKKIAKLLLIFNILSLTIINLYNLSADIIFRFFHPIGMHKYLMMKYSMNLLFLLNAYGFGVFWRILYFSSYVQTTKEISKFPLFKDLNVTNHVLLSFRLSSLVINCTKYITMITFKIFLRIMAILHIKKLKIIRGYKEEDELLRSLIKEDVLFNMIPFKLLSEELLFYILLLIVFIIYSKTSKIISTKRVLEKYKEI